MARITAGIATSHVPAIGAAFDQGRDQDDYWKPVFDGYEWVKEFQRREDPDAFAPLYEDLLAAGGTRTYVEALKPFGLNPRDKAFWAAGCAQLERLVDEFEALVG